MWDCENCGCQAIAGSLEVCPHCTMMAGMAASGWVEKAPESAPESAASGDGAAGADASAESAPAATSGKGKNTSSKEGW